MEENKAHLPTALKKHHKNEDKKNARVQLHPVPQMLDCSRDCAASSEEENGMPHIPANKPFALLLRLRVTQIVAGIVIVLLGAVACLDQSTRTTLCLGIPAGVLTVLAAVSHIHVSRREYTHGIASVHLDTAATPYWTTSILTRPFSALRPFLPTLACVLACVLLLALAASCLTSDDHNKVVLGYLQIATTSVVLSMEAIAWLFRYRWTSKE